MAIHLDVNKLKPNNHLFTFTNGAEGRSFIFKQFFMDRINEILLSARLSPIMGHSFWIGGTTAFLLAGVHPDVVKKMGRWSSDLFLWYW